MASLRDNNMRAAFTGKSASVQIPKVQDARDSFFAESNPNCAIIAQSMPDGRDKPTMLPTPPNSISPSLPPNLRSDQAATKIRAGPSLGSVESDLDLGASGYRLRSQGQQSGGQALNGSDLAARLGTAGAITPDLLARHYLPNLLIEHGPLAVRHLLEGLTFSVPGFSLIPPAKARRIVTAALEGHLEQGQVISLNPGMVFEKTGTGKWKARKVGQSERLEGASVNDTIPEDTITPSPSLHASDQDHEMGGTSVKSKAYSAGHIPPGSVLSASRLAHLDAHTRGVSDMNAPEDEADKMSLDGHQAPMRRGSAMASRLPDTMLIDNADDETDEEDWKSIGAEALRKSSLQSGGGFRRNYFALRSSRPSYRASSRGSPYDIAHSAPALARRNRTPNLRRKISAIEVDVQERAAVEALLAMSGK